MTTAQRNEHRTLYNQLRLALAFPGETVAGVTRLYEPVNKDGWSWDDAMNAPDTAPVASYRRREKGMWLAIGHAA